MSKNNKRKINNKKNNKSKVNKTNDFDSPLWLLLPVLSLLLFAVYITGSHLITTRAFEKAKKEHISKVLNEKLPINKESYNSLKEEGIERDVDNPSFGVVGDDIKCDKEIILKYYNDEIEIDDVIESGSCRIFK